MLQIFSKNKSLQVSLGNTVFMIFVVPSIILNEPQISFVIMYVVALAGMGIKSKLRSSPYDGLITEIGDGYDVPD